MSHHVPIKPEAPDPHSLATTWAVCALVELLVAHTHWPMDPHGVAEECRVGAINLLAKGIADCQSFSRVKQDTLDGCPEQSCFEVFRGTRLRHLVQFGCHDPGLLASLLKSSLRVRYLRAEIHKVGNLLDWLAINK